MGLRLAAQGEWRDAQVSEAEWWGTCANTFGEELKQLVYARRMGLEPLNLDGHWPVFDVDEASVLDIGGGPSSLLLKCVNAGTRTVIDPGEYPSWVSRRYAAEGIGYRRIPAEELERAVALRRGPSRPFEEAWIYNVLQHTIDPAKVIELARRAARWVRIFEWINVPPHQGHPHELRRDQLDQWLHGRGTIEAINEDGAVGTGYYGVFATVEEPEHKLPWEA